MNNLSIMIQFAAAALAAIGSAFAPSALAQTATTADNATSVQVTKHATNSYTISEGSAQVGSFDTVYLIAGSIADISESGDLITSTIQDDFNASSTIGYVMSQAAGSNNNSSAATLPNPFASSEEIRQRIADEIRNEVEAAERSGEANGEIICRFGMDLPGFECRFVPLLGPQ